MVHVMSPIRIAAAGERIVEPIIALAHCSKLARIIVTGVDSAGAVIDLHRLGYARAATTLNCGLPAGQYDVVLLDGRQRSIKAIETTLDWVSDFLSLTGVLIVWLDPLQPLSKSTSHGSTIHDCGEPFKLQSTLSWIAPCRHRAQTPTFLDRRAKLTPVSARPLVTTCRRSQSALPRSNRAVRRTSRAIPGRDGVYRCQEPISQFKPSRFGEIASRACRR